jgi:hypothetical protein
VTGRLEAWRLVTARGAIPFRLPRRRAALRSLREEVRALPPGTPVVLYDTSRRPCARCRRFAAETGVELEGVYLAVPSLASPLYLIQDTPQTLDYYWSDIVVLPLRAPLDGIAEIGLRVARQLGLGRWTRVLLPDRLAVGWRR